MPEYGFVTDATPFLRMIWKLPTESLPSTTNANRAFGACADTGPVASEAPANINPTRTTPAMATRTCFTMNSFRPFGRRAAYQRVVARAQAPPGKYLQCETTTAD